MVDEKKKDSLDFFKYLDSNFFNDFKTLLDNINQIDQPGYNDSTILNELNENQGIDPNLIINECCDFYNSVNPLYGEMAKSIVRDPSQVKFKCPRNPKDALNSYQTKVNINQNWNDVCILSHELAHGFVTPVNYEDREKQLNIFVGLLGEIPPIVVEYLSSDYLLEKRGVVANVLEKQRMSNVAYIYNNMFDENGYIGDLQEIINYIHGNHCNSSTEEIINSDFKYIILQFLNNFAYVIGILVANYIYLKIKENPDNVKMLDSMLTVLAKGEYYPEECIQLMEKLEIPIVQNGKISLSGDNMKKLYVSYFEKFNEHYTSTVNKSI